MIVRLLHKGKDSQRGASLPLALLLFLICAALSAVVLSAATASTGRLSELENTDQRYYSVMSAAQLLRDVLCEEGETITVTQTISSGKAEAVDSASNNLRKLLLGKAAEDLINEKDRAHTYNLTISSDDEGVGAKLGTVNIAQQVDADGNMTFTISSASTGPVYAVALSLAANATTTEMHSGGKMTGTRTEFTWETTGLRKASA